LVVEIDVAETFKRTSVCDMGARGICCGIVSVDQDGGNIEVSKEDTSGSSAWPCVSASAAGETTSADDKDICFSKNVEWFARGSHSQ